jgi:hypothetical protein
MINIVKFVSTNKGKSKKVLPPPLLYSFLDPGSENPGWINIRIHNNTTNFNNFRKRGPAYLSGTCM